MRTGRGILYCIYWIFWGHARKKQICNILFGACNLFLYLSISEIAKCLALSGLRWQARSSTSAITRSVMWIIVPGTRNKPWKKYHHIKGFFNIRAVKQKTKAHSNIFSIFTIPQLSLAALPLNYWYISPMYVHVIYPKVIV